MPHSNTWRNHGFEADFGTAVVLIENSRVNTSTTPVEFPSASTGITTANRGRYATLVAIYARYVAQGVTFTITESATTGGTYTAATVGSVLPKVVGASGFQVISVKPNPSKPFIRLVATGDNASTDFYVTAYLTFV
jgi:hypothetical protein